MKKVMAVLLAVTLFSFAAPCTLVFAESAMDQLENMRNTGTTFDGSDGRRSGMDIDFIDTTIEIPEPEAIPVDTGDED